MLESIIAGDTLSFTESVPAYPASAGWTLTYRLVPRSSSASAITFSASASGDEHAVLVAAATTAAWIAGSYSWSSYVTKTTQRFSIASGTVEILPDPATVAAGTDRRTHAQIVLEAIEAVIEGRASKDQEEFRIGERSLKRTPIADLLALKEAYEGKVARERLAAKGIDSRRVFVRFGNA